MHNALFKIFFLHINYGVLQPVQDARNKEFLSLFLEGSHLHLCSSYIKKPPLDS